MRRLTRWSTCGVAACCFFVGAERADAQPAREPGGMAPPKAATTISPTDQKFVQDAAASGLAEVKLSNLALERASSPQVKALAQQLITDHTKANDELKQIAQEKGYRLPTEPTAKQKADYERLSKLSGSAFDEAFLKQMQSDHQTAISLFDRESADSQSPALRSFASETLPTLRRHEQLIQHRME